MKFHENVNDIVIRLADLDRALEKIKSLFDNGELDAASADILAANVRHEKVDILTMLPTRAKWIKEWGK